MAIEVLQEMIRRKNSPLIVGLNPTCDAIPPQILALGIALYGDSPKGKAEAMKRYAIVLLDAVAPKIAGISLSPDCYLRYGSAGACAMEAVIAHARELGLYIILDARCAEDGYLAKAAAEAYLSGTGWDCDAVTVSGYSGTASLRPFAEYCRPGSKAIFLVAHTNSGTSREVQELITGGRMVYTAVADLAVRLTALEQLTEQNGYSSIGLVAGMNRGGELNALRQKYPQLFFLIPEYGVTGSHSKDVQGAMDSLGRGAAACVSLQVLEAWKQPDAPKDYAEAAAQAVERIRKNLLRGIKLR